VNNAAEVIRQAVDPQANVIFGVVLDPNMGNDVRLTLIATGFITKEAMAGAAKEKELSRILKGMEDDELDMPSYLRQREAYQSQRTTTGRKH
jgi:cell division protein FtsZ